MYFSLTLMRQLKPALPKPELKGDRSHVKHKTAARGRTR
jgi:hypothetical protein